MVCVWTSAAAEDLHRSSQHAWHFSGNEGGHTRDTHCRLYVSRFHSLYLVRTAAVRGPSDQCTLDMSSVNSCFTVDEPLTLPETKTETETETETRGGRQTVTTNGCTIQ